MQKDTIEKIGSATIQHGALNRRIYLMKLGEEKPENIIEQLRELAERNAYSKIFTKIPASAAPQFLRAGYTQEAEIPGFYNQREAACFVSLFADPQRAVAKNADEIAAIIKLARGKAASKGAAKANAKSVQLRVCKANEAEAMSDLYKKVFPSYPFPIDDPAYLRQTMRTHIIYYCAEIDGALAALSSAETDTAASNVEMTDFATLPEFRGMGLAQRLLARMEVDMREKDFATAYTIARAVEAGMNVVFARGDYGFGGTLINNTNISGQIESMNIWHKQL